jgi:hypothetical protein
MSNNLELWNSVEKTNPAYTKKANVKGNQITSIAPQFQIKSVTEKFGSYGVSWGFKTMEFDYTLKDIGMIVFNAVFFYPNGSFPIVNSVQLYKDGAQTKIDDDFAKKVETDTLTKAISKLGFNADIFLGKFDDIRYVNEMNNEFGNEQQKSSNYQKNNKYEQNNNDQEIEWLSEDSFKITLNCDNVRQIRAVIQKYSNGNRKMKTVFKNQLLEKIKQLPEAMPNGEV